MKRVIEFYRNMTGKCPTEEFLLLQNEKTMVKILSTFKLVETLDIAPKKFYKKITGTKLFEVRVEYQATI